MSYSPSKPDDPEIVDFGGYHGYMVMRYMYTVFHIPDNPRITGFCGYHGYVVLSYSPYISDEPKIVGFCGYHGYMVMRYICTVFHNPRITGFSIYQNSPSEKTPPPFVSYIELYKKILPP